MVKRILGECVGGPLDNQFMSVAEDQTEIGGFGDMRMEDDGTYIDKYVKDESSLRDVTETEQKMLAYLFDHLVTQICRFNYESNG